MSKKSKKPAPPVVTTSEVGEVVLEPLRMPDYEAPFALVMTSVVFEGDLVHFGAQPCSWMVALAQYSDIHDLGAERFGHAMGKVDGNLADGLFVISFVDGPVSNIDVASPLVLDTAAMNAVMHEVFGADIATIQMVLAPGYGAHVAALRGKLQTEADAKEVMHFVGKLGLIRETPEITPSA